MNQPEKEGVQTVSKRIIGAAVVGWLFLLAGVLLSAFVFHIFSLPEGAIPWVRAILSYIAAFLCGFLAAKGVKRKGFLKGFWAGVLFVVIDLIVVLTVQAQFRIWNAIILLVLSVFGGIVGINKKTKGKTKKGILRP